MGILSWNFTDTFWAHLRLILHLVKRGIIGLLYYFCRHRVNLFRFLNNKKLKSSIYLKQIFWYIINSSRPIGIFLNIASADKFSVWPIRSRRDFYFDGTDNGSAWAHSIHHRYVWCSHSPSCSPSSLTTVLSNTDRRSLSNNQIELLNKGIKMYTKKYETN